MSKPADWFSDAKLGIFIHWGIYTIPAFAPRGRTIVEIMRDHPDDGWAHLPYTEWYPNSIRFPQSAAAQHHQAVYGGKPYADFRPEFEAAAEAFDAGAWADLFARAGARYAVLVTKHHDGYCLWPSEVENPHRPGWRSDRDFVGELAGAVRARGLTFGTYYSGGLDWTFRHHPIATFGDLMACVPFEDDYRAYVLAHYRELMDRYGTDILWNDIAYPDEGDREALFQAFRERNPRGVLNDRWMASRGMFERLREPEPRARLDARIKARQAAGEEDLTPDNGLGDFRTPEYSERLDFGPDRAWEACRGMDMSFAFNAHARPEDYLTPEALIASFVEIVAHGGNLLLNMGPRADGSVPEPQVALLTALGDWLKTNGEAIYGTRPTARPKGIASDGTPYRTTAGRDGVNVLLLETPKSLEFTLPGFTGARSARRLDGGGVATTGGEPVRLTLAAPFTGPAPHSVVVDGANVLPPS